MIIMFPISSLKLGASKRLHNTKSIYTCAKTIESLEAPSFKNDIGNIIIINKGWILN